MSLIWGYGRARLPPGPPSGFPWAPCAGGACSGRDGGSGGAALIPCAVCCRLPHGGLALCSEVAGGDVPVPDVARPMAATATRSLEIRLFIGGVQRLD